MRSKKLGVVLLSLILCMAAASCGDNKEPDPSVLQTPQYSIAELTIPEPPAEDKIHTASQGVKIIAPNNKGDDGAEQETELAASSPVFYMSAVTPELVWEDDSVVTYNAFTLPEKAAFDDGSIGVLSISKIGLTVSVYESADQMEDMDKGAAHFKSTSSWDGNIGLSGHNRTSSGYGAYFQDLHKLSVGDTLTYKTALGEREYRVTTVKTINDDDWSYLSRTADNRLTMVTCLSHNASKRLLVQAVQK